MNFLLLLGGFIGLVSNGWKGLLIGALIGHLLNRTLRFSLVRTASRFQAQFLDTTFAVMGAVCKADGRVSPDEIQMAEHLFDHLHLRGDAREAAKRAFNRGKAADFDIDAAIATFVRGARGQRALHQIFLQVQLSALAADGHLHDAELALLKRIGRGLGMSDAEIERLVAAVRRDPSARMSSPLDEAYQTLGVAASAPNPEIKKAYRQLMSQHHPDKLAAKGLPESMREVAEQKTREITAAYQLIERTRAAAT